MPATKPDLIRKLQNDILSWQGFSAPKAAEQAGIGLGPLESAFPNGVFPTGVIHEMVCPTPEHGAATIGLLGGMLGSLMSANGACLWISTAGRMFPPALTVFGVDPHRIICIDVRRDKEALWAMEEALKYEGLAAVIAEIRDISFSQSRRLQLATESSRVTGFLLRNDPRKPGITTCVARWQVNPLPSAPADGLPGIGFPRWQVELQRIRNGNPGSWTLEWSEGRFVPVEQVKPELEIDIPVKRIAG